MRPVYPRWRGELETCHEVDLSVGGLSPLARGTLHEKWQACQHPRFIPAGAGNSTHAHTARSPDSVYPR
ncbi:hypothetical protein ECRM12581_17760 [Escherichia coli O145:H28 str. RM12581]|uniref:Uncharacterized protein n=1 Tax=Escherichia coli O145:H28 (strain RM12581) TaxID=1248823 RepID=A0ABC7ZWC7_ECOLR|nr:hypothetical protein ECRM13514_3607 [Escherichia coli O145:H28 str. RM13514]AHY72082.1 hypothetical protein ECRM12581_17760 [Escherichia coli O145:H28 str. RM12581]